MEPVKPQELRIGNIVSYVIENAPVKVLSITYDHNGNYDIETINLNEKENPNCERECDSIYPIPLTEEWLLKAGFELKDEVNKGFAKQINEQYGVSHYYLYANSKYFTTCLIDNKKPYEIFINPVQYVHQLQNLYFALTGQELTFKE